jgi:hypothetical protein
LGITISRSYGGTPVKIFPELFTSQGAGCCGILGYNGYLRRSFTLKAYLSVRNKTLKHCGNLIGSNSSLDYSK